MLARYLMIFAVLFVVSACSSTEDETLVDDTGMGVSQGTAPADGPLSNIYGDNMGAGNAAPGTQADLVANVGDRVFFGTDRFDLSAEARAVLDAQAKWLNQYPNLSITIEGHADERGTREYNIALGDRRADSVRSYLTALGVDSSRINTISYGKERPAVVGNDESAWAQNRRSITQVQ